MQTGDWSRSSLGRLFLQDIFLACEQKKALSQLAVGNEVEWSLDEKQTVGGRDAAIEYLHGVFTARLRFVQTPVTREQYLSTHNGYIAKKKPPKFGGKRGVNISA